MARIKTPQTSPKNLVTEASSQHVKEHRALAVADRRRSLIKTITKAFQRKVVRFCHVVGELLQNLTPMLHSGSRLLLKQMVGKVGGQALAPIS